MYYHAGHDHLNLGGFQSRFVMHCLEALSQVTRKKPLFQIKISHMEKSVLMILNMKYIYWHFFFLAKLTLEMGKGFLWQLSYFSVYTVADWSIDLYLEKTNVSV